MKGRKNAERAREQSGGGGRGSSYRNTNGRNEKKTKGAHRASKGDEKRLIVNIQWRTNASKTDPECV